MARDIGSSAHRYRQRAPRWRNHKKQSVATSGPPGLSSLEQLLSDALQPIYDLIADISGKSMWSGRPLRQQYARQIVSQAVTRSYTNCAPGPAQIARTSASLGCSAFTALMKKRLVRWALGAWCHACFAEKQRSSQQWFALPSVASWPFRRSLPASLAEVATDKIQEQRSTQQWFALPSVASWHLRRSLLASPAEVATDKMEEQRSTQQWVALPSAASWHLRRRLLASPAEVATDKMQEQRSTQQWLALPSVGSWLAGPVKLKQLLPAAPGLLAPPGLEGLPTFEELRSFRAFPLYSFRRKGAVVAVDDESSLWIALISSVFSPPAQEIERYRVLRAVPRLLNTVDAQVCSVRAFRRLLERDLCLSEGALDSMTEAINTKIKQALATKNTDHNLFPPDASGGWSRSTACYQSKDGK